MVYQEVIKEIEKIAPPYLAFPWDNSGVQIYTGTEEIRKILVCLEVTGEIVKEAGEVGVDLIVSHHPLIFTELKNIDAGGGSKGRWGNKVSDQITGKYIVDLIQKNISVYSAHTSFDFAPGGNNTYLGDRMGLEKVVRPEVRGEPVPGYVGEFNKTRSLKEVAETLREVLNVPLIHMRTIGCGSRLVKKVALCTGAGGDMLPYAVEMGCDLLVTGDVRFHEAQLARSAGISLIDGGHFGTEKIFEKNFADQLRKILDRQVEVLESRVFGNPWNDKTFVDDHR